MLAVLAPYVAAFLAAAVTGYRAGGQPTTLVLTQLVLLGVLLSISGAFLNVGAFYVGLPVDFVEWAGTGVLALLSLPFYLGLGLTGGILGAWLNPSRDPGTMHAA